MIGGTDLRLFVECHGFTCALEARAIDRLVLPEEVREVNAGVVPVVEVTGVRFVTFNLGRLLGLSPTDGAYILMRLTYAGTELRVALETGQCLLVAPPVDTTPFPAAMFRSRRKAIIGAFAVADGLRGGGRRAAVGLAIDVAELLTVQERDAAVRSLKGIYESAVTR